MLIPETGVHQISERYFSRRLHSRGTYFIIRPAADITFATTHIPLIIRTRLPSRATTTIISCCFSYKTVHWS